MSHPLLQVNVSAGYGKKTVLDQASFTLQPGERLGLVGTSGAGKSTLVLTLLGLLPLRGGWIRGEVLLHGKNLLTLPEREARRLRGSEIALVPQSPMTALNHALSLKTHFEEAWMAHVKGQKSEMQARVTELIGQMRLPAEATFLDRRPGEISVGQAQRVALALALLHRPAILIADEPTSSLDPVTSQEVLRLLHDIGSSQGTSLLLISHDLISVVLLCERVAVLDQTSIVDTFSLDPGAGEPTHPASLALLSTLPAPMASMRRMREK